MEGIYQTTLGRSSLAWLYALEPREILQAQDASSLKTYDMLLYCSQGLVVHSEMSLYPYVYIFYLTGKAMYETSKVQCR